MSQAQLDREVRFITARLGATVRAQEGDAVLDSVNQILRLSVAARRGSARAAQQRAHLVARIPDADLYAIAHAFSLYFQLVNLCEERERMRRLQARPSPSQSLLAAFSELKQAGVDPDTIQALVDQLLVEPVITAHPTEAKRRTVIKQLVRLAASFDAPDEVLETLWQTTELRDRGVSPDDEIDTAAYFLESTMLPALPAFYRAFDAALAVHYPEVQRGRTFLRFASWVGGDRDGNPFVTPETSLAAAGRNQDVIHQIYRGHAEALADELSQDAGGTSLQPVIPVDGIFLGQPGEIYRRVARTVADRLARGELDAPGMTRELGAVREALLAQNAPLAAGGRLQDVLVTANACADYGVHLDFRDHVTSLTAARQDVLDQLEVIRHLQDQHGEAVAHRLILSMTLEARDVLAALTLAREAGVQAIDIIPLFETIDALQRGPEILQALWSDPVYQRHLEARGNRQEVMLGYSDSNRDGGYVAANWFLDRAQRGIARLAEAQGVDLVFFHGKGGTIDRGGGAGHRLLRAQPDAAPGGRIRVTEQGEVVSLKYSNPLIAQRTLEQLVSGVLLGQLLPPPDAGYHEDWAAVMDDLARSSFQHYRALVYDDARLEDYFWSATPIDFIDRLRLGSRPARRSQERDVGNLRAIPWVFSWSQSRHLLSAWYGLGHAVATGRAPLEDLQGMYREWPFFTLLVDNAAASLAKTDLGIARAYAALEPDEVTRQHVYGLIAAEHDLAVDAVLAISQQSTLLGSQPVLRDSIARRNPFVDPLHDLQVRALAAWRAEGRPEHGEMVKVLALTVNGIAFGMKSTG